MSVPHPQRASGVQSAQQHIKDLLGLDFGSVPAKSVQRAVQIRRQALDLAEEDDYALYLDGHPEELQCLVDEVTVPETWFNRESEAIETMVSLARQAKRSGRTTPFRILSVPCAGGEEPYSLAMAMFDAGFAPEQFIVVAADVSRRSLRRAEKGIYSEASFRGRQLGFRSRYFDQRSDGYHLKEAVKSQVTFHHDNILSSLFLARAETFDFLFCRNLFIYFQPEARQRPLDHIVRLLKPEGSLFCAVAEYSYFSRAPFRLEKVGSAYVCRLTPPFTSESPAPRTPLPSSPLGEGQIRTEHPGIVGRAAKRGQRSSESREGQAGELELSRARRLADEGFVAESASICESILKSGMDSVEAFSLLALLRETQGRLEEAVQLYRKAVYLDPQHYESLVHLALLRGRLGDEEEAAMLRARAKRAHLSRKQMS